MDETDGSAAPAARRRRLTTIARAAGAAGAAMALLSAATSASAQHRSGDQTRAQAAPARDGIAIQSGNFRQQFGLMLPIDGRFALADESGVVVQDAYLDTIFSPAFRIRIGKTKHPIGFERYSQLSF